MKGRNPISHYEMRLLRPKSAAFHITFGNSPVFMTEAVKTCGVLLRQCLGSFTSIIAFHLLCTQQHLYQNNQDHVSPWHLPKSPYAHRDVAPEWRCEVLFCDDSSRFESLNQLTERHTELAARQQQLQAKLDSANRVGAFLVNDMLLNLCSISRTARRMPVPNIQSGTVYHL